TIVNNAKNLNITFSKENGVNYISDNDCLKIIEKITKKESTVEKRETDKKEITNENTSEAKNAEYSNFDINETLKTKEKEIEKQKLAIESNKKIQKLESQLEEERQLNYSFDTSSNDRQNVNAQEAKFTEETKDFNQQPEKEQPTELQRRDIPEENEDENLNNE